MKYRNDFVTNSSSSSFIGVFAKVEDMSKAEPVIKKYELVNDLRSGKAILEEMKEKYFYGYGADWAGVDLTPSKRNIDPNALYLIWESYGGAGDDDSCFETSYGDLDYDVDFEDFTGKEQLIYDSIREENGFTNIESGFGAGRNG